ncbi:TPA: type I-F CRISPR-associated protein Csy2 [Enterobacter cloacae]|uniref:type I-F CRISPR-associated protein Csy2 n=1 Tax=Enterobacter cloacae complex TaxID=354276 RepID=UPI000FDAB423|nr:type I-F CRISPR-associated protein Csy2 [Enterobacter cloacae]MCL8189997.1 type I-F CRISPR-associated protein Csy2 [Enterobacter cloacae]MCM8140356.1 type I-F CRISPR-associated protein Csy2 [Enterobacter cloacae]MDH1187438.1 type I-F CRISPR-associated protein Csy2 [Enterobacter cloacae]HAS1729978.1 type I-F CRISPR-associated protein Csy2 [Enterobacter cloacae]HAV2099141.1 type I-F CRISPR-associated protein Csy2 [Enterobacter cloacae]
MSSLILLRRVRVENANAVAGLTWGFPAITHFMGFSHALSRRLTEKHGLHIDGCAVVSHGHQIHAHTSGRDYQFALTRNPLTREAKTASFNEEGRMHLTVSLLLECHGEIPNGEYGQRDLAEFLSQICPTLRLAGGIIVDIQNISVMAMPASVREMGRLQWQLMPGFALRDRSSWLGEHHQTLLENNPDATLLDAWLDFASLKMQAEMPDEGDIQEGDPASWHYVPKPKPGYLVPLMTGYQRISELYAPGVVANARDAETPFAFTEAVYGVGEWCGLHRIRSLEDIFWRYRTTETGYYCQGTSAPVTSEPLN